MGNIGGDVITANADHRRIPHIPIDEDRHIGCPTADVHHHDTHRRSVSLNTTSAEASGLSTNWEISTPETPTHWRKFSTEAAEAVMMWVSTSRR